MPYQYEWPMAAPCSAILIYTRSGNEVRLLTTHRDASVGTGRSLSAGGFYEVKDMFNKTGKIQDGDAEIYREMVEELGEQIKTIIPYEDFEKRVTYVWDCMVTSPDPQIVHNVIFKALEISPAEMEKIMALPRTDEQTGKTIEKFMLNEKESAESVLARLADFKYPHEAQATVRWLQALKAAPSF